MLREPSLRSGSLRGARSLLVPAGSPRLAPSLLVLRYARTCGVSGWAKSLRLFGTCLFALLRRLRRIFKKNLRRSPPAHPLRIANSGCSPCLLRRARSFRFASSPRRAPEPPRRYAPAGSPPQGSEAFTFACLPRLSRSLRVFATLGLAGSPLARSERPAL